LSQEDIKLLDSLLLEKEKERDNENSQTKKVENNYNSLINSLGALSVVGLIPKFNFFNIFGNQKTKETPKSTFAQNIEIKRIVRINNISGKKAWIILSPTPIMHISKIKIDDVGTLYLYNDGDYKYQEVTLSNFTSQEFELDNSDVYYSVFFESSGIWKFHSEDRKLNDKKYNINILERHFIESIDLELFQLITI